MSRENVEMIRRCYEAFNRRDFDAALADFDDAITWKPAFPAGMAVLEGKEALRAQWTSRVEALDLHVEPQELIAVGDSGVIVVARWIGRGQLSGTPVEEARTLAFKMQAGKVVRVEGYASKEEALQAVGMRE
jgi:ketosteroid isomerase-like protein